jgi:small conductance mechanosensitive channel
MHYDLRAITQTALAVITSVGLKIIGAGILFYIGRTLIRLASTLMEKALNTQKIDRTLVSYAGTSLTVLLNIVLGIALLGLFGVETTSFAALLAGVGLAIGAAWSGLLGNFAAGVFLVILRPFHVGDHIHAAGVTGHVDTIGLFVTTLHTSDNILMHIGNNKIFSENIQNYTTNPYRRIEIETQLDKSVDPMAARELLLAALANIPNVLATPKPVVELLKFTSDGPVLTVRPFCHDRNYWQVYFDTNKTIWQTFHNAGYPWPEPTLVFRTPEPPNPLETMPSWISTPPPQKLPD